MCLTWRVVRDNLERIHHIASSGPVVFLRQNGVSSLLAKDVSRFSVGLAQHNFGFSLVVLRFCRRQVGSL